MNLEKIQLNIESVERVTIVFIILKLVGVIDWSWFWVLSPMIFGIGLELLIAGIVEIVNSRDCE